MLSLCDSPHRFRLPNYFRKSFGALELPLPGGKNYSTAIQMRVAF